MQLLACSNVHHFSTTKESMIALKVTNYLRKNLANLHDVKKIEIYFPRKTFVSYIC